jgi:hypothetical protein
MYTYQYSNQGPLQQSTMARRFNWKKSAAKAIIMSDLESGILDEDVPLPRVAWDQVYRHMQEFADVTFEQFGRNLVAERNRFSTNRNQAAQEELFMKRDRQLHPRKEFNSRGEPVFDMHVAKLELREDVEAGRHKGKTPSDFQETRTNYESFDETIFKKRIYQEERLQKYYNYRNLKQAAERQHGIGQADGVIFGIGQAENGETDDEDDGEE